MKKLISILLIMLILLSTAAYAKVPTLSEGLFKYAKNALKALAAGDYQKVVTSLPFSDVSPSVKEWSSFAEGSFTVEVGENTITFTQKEAALVRLHIEF